MPSIPGLIAGTVATTALVITLGLRSRLGLARALAIGLAGAMLGASGLGLWLLDHDALARAPLLRGLVLVLVGWVLVIAWLRRRWPVLARSSSSELGARLGSLGLLLVLGMGTAIRLDPSPYLHGGQDQGIYVNVGHHIARTGRLRPVDPLLAGKVPGLLAVDVHASHELRPIPEGSPLAGVREGRWNAGLHIEDASEGRIIPAFFHLLPVWLAITELDFGFARSTWALVLFAGLAQLAAFGLGYRLGAGDDDDDLGDRRRAWAVGLIAATGLALNPLDLWISTFPVTENLARTALLGAAWLGLEASRAERKGEPGALLMAALAGLVFAAGAFARGSMLALAIVLALTLVVAPNDAPKTRATLLSALVIGATLAAIQAILHSWPYFFSAASNHFHVPRIQPFQAEAVNWAVAIGAGVLVIDRAVVWLRRRWPRLELGDRVVAIGVTLMLLGALAALGYRVLDPSDAYAPSQSVAAVLLRHCGPFVLALALVGLFAAAWRARPSTRVWVVLAAAIVLISALKEGVRYEFYYARYLVGDALPVIVVAAAWALGEGSRRVAARVGPKPAALGLGLLLLAWWGPSVAALNRPVFWTRDLEHGPEDLAAMFERVPDDAVLIFDSREPLRWRGILATPAFMSFGKRVLVYPNQRLIERAINAGTPIYMVSGGWEPDDHQRWGGWRTQVVARGHYRARRADVIEGAMPRALSEWGGPWELQVLDRSIWRSTGAFSLYPGSRFIVKDDSNRIESGVIELEWRAGAHVELLVDPGSLEGCTIGASLVGRESNPLPLVPDAGPASARKLYRFVLPEPPRAPISAKLELGWRCEEARTIPWRRLSLRWD